MSKEKNIPVPYIENQNPSQISQDNIDQKTPYQGIINIPSSVNIYDSNDMYIKKREVSICKLRVQYLITIFIFLVISYDITLQIYYRFINFFGMADNIIIFFLIIKLLSICIHKKNFNSKLLSLVNALIILFGFCLKGFSLAYCMRKEDVVLLIIYSLGIGSRTFGLIWLFPLTCRK